MNTDNRIELLRWYDARRRELPWRRTREPYRIWVSEVMLQQTRAETVIPYYKHFLQRFPTIAALAAAETEEVLSLWSGLGYYRRARQLHRAARMLVEEGGEIPRSVDALRRLPGVGPYTAAAVASIAFGVAVPALDGNVVRVLARRQALAGNPRSAEVRRQLESAAARLLAPQRPGDSNQALMDLGATVCKATQPGLSMVPPAAGLPGSQ